MRRRRRLIAIAMFVTPLLIIAGACTFPEVTFGPAPTGSEKLRIWSSKSKFISAYS